MNENDCRKFEESFSGVLGGVTEGVERREVMRHLAHCESCAELFAVHAELEEIEIPAPADRQFLEMRREVLRSIRSGGETASLGLWSVWQRVLANPLPAVALTVAALVIGFLAGRWQPSDGPLPSAGLAAERQADSDAFAGQLELAAIRNEHLDQSANSPYTFSNLRAREVDENTVALSFDVATHLELVRDKRDPLVAEIMVQSLVNPAPVGTRLEAISLIRSMEPKVKDALIVALLEDPSLPVRLGALTKLSEQPMDEKVEKALLGVLQREKSVQMRLQAVDLLAEQKVAPERVEEAVLSGQPEPGRAVAVRVQDYFGTF